MSNNLKHHRLHQHGFNPDGSTPDGSISGGSSLGMSSLGMSSLGMSNLGGFGPDGLGPDNGFAGFPAFPSLPEQPDAPPPPAPTHARTALDAPSAGNTAGTTATGSGNTTITSVTTTASPFVINITWDASVASAPTGFTAAVLAAAQYLESQFTNAVTLNISIGYGEVNGTALGSGTLGSSESFLNRYSYAKLRSALAKDATSTTDQAAVASLPSAAPVSGAFWTTAAEAKALGLAAATGTSTDGYVGFSSTLPFTYGTGGSIAGGTYDFNDVALHELSEVMGRLMLTGGTIGTTANSYSLLDLFHYSSPGVRDFSASTPGYFSVDGGNTNLGAFNTVAGGDAGDWASSMGNNAFDAFSPGGVVNPVTQGDLNLIDTLGWTRTGIIAAAPVTAGLAPAQTSAGLAAGATLAAIAPTGGSVTDAWTFALGGSGAGSFSLTTTGSVATLSAGPAGVAGATGGRLYALTVTPTDTTTGATGPTSPLDVIVGAAGNDTISVASLTGALGTATPTFIYGLGGNDALKGTGMTGRLDFIGGGGGDTMTGGSGVNDYLFGATSDSTAAAMDVITNFHTATDLIDLTGLGTSLTVAGTLAGTSLAADSVGWQTAGRGTYVYVNTSAAAEALTGTNMKIGLSGVIALNSSNIVHV